MASPRSLPSSTIADRVDVSTGNPESLRELCPGEIGGTDLSNIVLGQTSSPASSRVYTRSNGFQMRRIQAIPLRTEVIDLGALGNRANFLFIDCSVGKHRLTSQPDSVVPVFVDRRVVTDPANSGKSSVFFMPEIGGHNFATLQITNMASYESDVMSSYMAESDIRHLRQGSDSTTSALTNPGRVRWNYSKGRSRPLGPMTSYPSLWFALFRSLSGRGLWDKFCFLSASAGAKHSCTLTHCGVS